jgi:uncharacterized membrane protein YgcG
MHTLLYAHLAHTLATERTHTSLRRREQQPVHAPGRRRSWSMRQAWARAIDLLQPRLPRKKTRERVFSSRRRRAISTSAMTPDRSDVARPPQKRCRVAWIASGHAGLCLRLSTIILVAVAVLGASAAAAQASWSAGISLQLPRLTSDGSLNSVNAVACPSITQCTAVDSDGDEATFNPLAPGTPSVAKVDPDVLAGSDKIMALSCATVTQCTIVDEPGRVATFDPQAPARATPTPLGGGEGSLDGIACPSATQCTAVGYGAAATFNPQSPGSPSLDFNVGGDMRSVACPTTSHCVAVDSSGGAVSFDPNALGTASPATIGSFFTTVSCPSASQCSAVGTGEVTFDPSAAAVTPKAGNVDSPSNFMYGLACPATDQCIATDLTGNAFTFDPNNPGSPTPTVVDDDHSNFGAVACPAIGECAAVDGKGDVFIEPAPAGSGGSGGGSGGSGGGSGGSGGGPGGSGGGQSSQKATLSHAALWGLATGKPKLAFTVVGGAHATKSLTVYPPSGVSFSHSARNRVRGLSVRTGNRTLKYSASVIGRNLRITLRGTATSIRVVISSPALTVTNALERKVKHGQDKGFSLSVTATDSTRVITKLTLHGLST